MPLNVLVFLKSILINFILNTNIFLFYRFFDEEPDIFINASATKAIIQNHQFWYDVDQLKMMLNPAKNAIKALEFTTTLADCFMELVKMARAISQISLFQNHEFKSKCIAIFNKR